MKVIWASLFLILTTACNASRVSGTYVCHGPGFAVMLQLTATQNGGIDGVFSSVEMKDDGSINSQQAPITGTVDGAHLTLAGKSLLSSLFGSSVAGTITGNTITLHMLDSNGNVSSAAFVRGTPDEFKYYADEIKSKGEGVKFSKQLLNGSQELRAMVQNAEHWMADAEMHAGRIPNAKAAYRQVEDGMRSLIEQERRTLDPNARIQISLQVGQGDLAGGQIDLQVDQIWDIDIGSSGKDMKQTFANWNAKCGTPEELQKRGASKQAIESWLDACKQTVAERAKFDAIYGHIMEQRADLKSFEATTQARRKALVDEANRMQ